MSFEDYKSNKDPILDAALNFSDTAFILSPMDHFTTLFMAGNIDQLKNDAAQMIKDPTYRFFDFEGQFNKVGYRLLNSGQNENALFVFLLVTEFFLDSANACDSLAEDYLKSGDALKATEFYNKALKMDPDGPTGKNAREMLRTIATAHQK